MAPVKSFVLLKRCRRSIPDLLLAESLLAFYHTFGIYYPNVRQEGTLFTEIMDYFLCCTLVYQSVLF
jgi:hypothetical protein